ncbi:MAG TPA: 7-cyano-7-deazaguanine synthase [bacterium]|nr:7-cyano-7-deazaguanine synthase [bacterium]
MPGIKNMNKKAVVLLSGGLDSTLALCILKEQGVEIEAVNFQTMFGCCKDDARSVATRFGVPLTFLKVGDDYLKVIQNPKYGYGRGINPCVDCRGYMFDLAKRYMEQCGASFLVTGEVLDQRPMSQKKNDFVAIEAETGMEGRVLRPLSAKLLPPTEPEKAGLVDREKLFAVHGRSRRVLLQLAARYGIENPPSPSAGCALTSPDFAKKVRDVFDHHPDYERWEFEILKMGRHFRLDDKTKVVIARNENQNEYFENIHPPGSSLLTCRNFAGPHALLIGEKKLENLEKAGKLMLRYAPNRPALCEIQVEKDGEMEVITVSEPLEELTLESLRIV